MQAQKVSDLDSCCRFADLDSCFAFLHSCMSAALTRTLGTEATSLIVAFATWTGAQFSLFLLGHLWLQFWSHFGTLLGAMGSTILPKGAPALPRRSPHLPLRSHWCCRGALLRSSHRFRHPPGLQIGPETSKIVPKGYRKGFKKERVLHS